MFINMVKAGEAGGNMDETLEDWLPSSKNKIIREQKLSRLWPIRLQWDNRCCGCYFSSYFRCADICRDSFRFWRGTASDYPIRSKCECIYAKILVARDSSSYCMCCGYNGH